MGKSSRGLLQVYTGDGKGKTTAATGLMARALGQGWKVLLVRFLKPAEPVSGELHLLRAQANFTLIDAGKGVIGRAVDPDEMRRNASATFDKAAERLLSGDFDMVVFDELNGCLDREYLTAEALRQFLDRSPEKLEVVCTGRRAPDWLLERADLVTRMEKLRHPYDAGIAAREGIEY